MHELAKRITYQKYEDGRIIGEEGRETKRIYHLLSGKINYVRKFELKQGNVFKLVGHLNQDEFTDVKKLLL